MYVEELFNFTLCGHVHCSKLSGGGVGGAKAIPGGMKPPPQILLQLSTLCTTSIVDVARVLIA